MNLSLKGKTAVVGGGSKGIGRATALGLAALGCRVLVLARGKESLQQVKKELQGVSAAAHDYLAVDFTQPTAVRASITEKLDQWGEVHILVNNTGGPPPGTAIEASADDYLKAFTMHLLANQVLAQVLTAGMRRSGYGRIINVISTSVKQPLPNLGVSNTVRGAVASWSKTLANELAPHGITVNNVLPGATNTDRLRGLAERKASETGATPDEVLAAMGKQVPLQRVAKPEEIAAAICFLASPAASYINGINLPVDGGRTACL